MVSNTILLAGILAAGVLQGVKCNAGTSQNRPTYEKEHTVNGASHGQSGYENYGPAKAKEHDVTIPTHGQGTYGGYGGDVYDPLRESHTYGSPASGRYHRGQRGVPTNVENQNIPNQVHGEPPNYKYLTSVPAYGHGSHGDHGQYPVLPSYVPGDYENQGVFKRGEFVSQVPGYGQDYGDYGNYGDYGGRVPLPYYGGDSYGINDYGGNDIFGQGGWFPFNNQERLMPNFGYGDVEQQLYPFINGRYGGYGQGSLYPFAYHRGRGNIGQGQRGPYSGYNGYSARLPYGSYGGYGNVGSDRVLPHHVFGGHGPYPVYLQYVA